MTREEQTIKVLVQALEDAAYHISELGCTCVHRRDGHQRGCQGNTLARPYEALTRRIRRRMATQEPAAGARRP